MKYLPDFGEENETKQTSGIIRDLVIGLQTDRCTLEACPRLRLIVDMTDQSKVVIPDSTTLKNLIAIYGDKVSQWIGQKVSVCYHPKDLRRGGIRILPVIE